jgi:hypothetical protein
MSDHWHLRYCCCSVNQCSACSWLGCSTNALLAGNSLLTINALLATVWTAAGRGDGRQVCCQRLPP